MLKYREKQNMKITEIERIIVYVTAHQKSTGQSAVIVSNNIWSMM